MGYATCRAQRRRLRRLAAHQRGQELRRQPMRRPGDGRAASVLGWEPAAQESRPGRQGRHPQETCPGHGVRAAINSDGRRHINRRSLTTLQPKVETSTISLSTITIGSELELVKSRSNLSAKDCSVMVVLARWCARRESNPDPWD